MIFCSKCGEAIPNDSVRCPVCGCDLSSQKETVIYASQIKMDGTIPTENVITPATPELLRKKKRIGIGMCIAGCIALLLALVPITSDDYRYNVENYEYYVSEAQSAALEAESYSWGLLKSGYETVADGWQALADDAKKDIWTARVEAILCAGVGIVLIAFGYKNIKVANEDEKTSK